MQIDWSEYARVHAGRTNLLIHLFAVPLFVGAFLFLLVSVWRGDGSSAVVASALCLGAMAMQGRGHRQENEPPRPFTGLANFLRRWFTEQFVVFPLFLLSGRRWRQYRDAGTEHHESRR